MHPSEWIQTALFVGALLIFIPYLGTYIAQIFSGERSTFTPLEKLVEGASGVTLEEMSWIDYAKALLLFNGIGFLFLFALLLIQGFLPLNPLNLPGVDWTLAFNIAASFVTNTNWQSYAGETTLTPFTQMVGLTTQNFLSAGTGLAVMDALARGIGRISQQTVGNFWSDLIRSILYLLLPLSIIFAIYLVSQGVVQTFDASVEVNTLEQGVQRIPLGPVASQEAIKQLGTNGGGYYNANSAHPFENPTIWTNFFAALALILIPASCVYAYGVMIKAKKHAILLLSVMFMLWMMGLMGAHFSEMLYNPLLQAAPVLEGKETRLGEVNSVLWAITTTATGNGSVNAMHSSLSPLAGGITLFNIMLGELIFGGVGVGVCSIIFFTLLTVFLCGLMVGRSPAYQGKKLERREIQFIMVAILMPGVLVLVGTGLTTMLPSALASLGNKGPHGLSEILYAFSSAAGNNGSAFAGLNANTPYYNLLLGIVMILGRLSVLIPSLAVAGSLVGKKSTPHTVGTFSTESFFFCLLLASIIVGVGGLSFFPSLSLGPIVEQILMRAGESF